MDCSVRNQVMTVSRMEAELGLSSASLRTLSREGAPSGGEYSLSKQRLRSSSSYGASAMMRCTTFRKLAMDCGALLGESRHANSIVLRWS